MKAEISLIIHATEDYKKVVRTLGSILDISSKSILRHDLSGHYGNPLIYCKIKLKNDDAEKLLYRIKSLMDPMDLEYLKIMTDEYYDKKNFYLRIDKQSLCKGFIKLATVDPIRIVFKNINIKKLEKLLFE